MKSIKEKAAEYRKIIKVINEHESLVDTQGSEIFEEGAYYVLNEIETITKADLGSYKSQLDRIKNIIEQLKK
jgi:predicted nucleotidyltransferase